MLYAILCYNDENILGSWTRQEEEAYMARLAAVREELAREVQLGIAVHLLPTSTAITVRQGRDIHVIDGPYAETKEQLLAILLIDCKSLTEATAFAQELARMDANSGAFEVRPIVRFNAAALEL
jgi:hypothetical protein